MQVSSIIDQLPYPIASVYANLEDAQASAQTRREAIYFTGYQLIPAVLHSYRIAGDEMAALGYLAPVPEPGSVALLLGGLGLIGWSARRRRAQCA